jgi:hypothetical protein
MTMQGYRDKILKPTVDPRLRAGRDFVLKEDKDSGHGGLRKKNIIVYH